MRSGAEGSSGTGELTANEGSSGTGELTANEGQPTTMVFPTIGAVASILRCNVGYPSTQSLYLYTLIRY